MSFIMKGAPYSTDNTPIYNVDMEDGVLGKANNNGSITLNNKIKDPEQIDEVIDHEMVHIDQMKRGDLDYDDDNVIWKGKKYSRASMKEGAKNLPWEKEAYNKNKK
jgi:predicted RNA-binding protein with PUA domain